MIKKVCFLLFFALGLYNFTFAEGITFFTGTTSKKVTFGGTNFGGEIIDYLQWQLDAFKYIKKDPDLSTDNPLTDRGDFLGISLNFALKLPIHLIPYLDQFDYIQPYIVQGYGFCLESLAGDYLSAINKVDNKSGVFSKVRSFNSFGYGVVFMISPAVGIKVDSRSVNINEHKGMALEKRKFTRFSIGLSFGTYKEPVKRIKKPK